MSSSRAYVTLALLAQLGVGPPCVWGSAEPLCSFLSSFLFQWCRFVVSCSAFLPGAAAVLCDKKDDDGAVVAIDKKNPLYAPDNFEPWRNTGYTNLAPKVRNARHLVSRCVTLFNVCACRRSASRCLVVVKPKAPAGCRRR